MNELWEISMVRAFLVAHAIVSGSKINMKERMQ